MEGLHAPGNPGLTVWWASWSLPPFCSLHTFSNLSTAWLPSRCHLPSPNYPFSFQLGSLPNNRIYAFGRKTKNCPYRARDPLLCRDWRRRHAYRIRLHNLYKLINGIHWVYSEFPRLADYQLYWTALQTNSNKSKQIWEFFKPPEIHQKFFLKTSSVVL